MNITNGNFTFTCPHCEQHLEAEPDMAGMELDCPTCGQKIIVPQPPRPAPVIKVLSEPKIKTTPKMTQTIVSSQKTNKAMPKWGYCVIGAVLLVGLSIVIAFRTTEKDLGDKRGSSPLPRTSIEQNEDDDIDSADDSLAIKPSEAESIYEAALDELYDFDDAANLVGDVFKAYSQFEKAKEMGYNLAEVAISHLLWTQEEVREAKCGKSPIWIAQMQHAARALDSPLAKAEYGFFLFFGASGNLGKGNRNEGWELIQEAAREGCLSALQFVKMIAKQMSSPNHLSLDFILEIYSNDKELLAGLQRMCSIGLMIEYKQARVKSMESQREQLKQKKERLTRE